MARPGTGYWHHRIEALRARDANPSIRQAMAMVPIIERVRASANADSLPTNLMRVAQHLGVASVEFCALTSNAVVMLGESGRYVVRINKTLSDFDRRRALAHELVHLVIEQERFNASRLTGQVEPIEGRAAYAQIEARCDAGAAEFLMPRRWMFKATGGAPPSLQLVSELARSADVDIWFALDRVLSLGQWGDARAIWLNKDHTVLRVAPQFRMPEERHIRVLDFIGGPPSDDADSLATWQSPLRLMVVDEVSRYIGDCIQAPDGGVISLIVPQTS